ncbi:MAG: GTPase KRas precursor [Candidatus Heimdallarchaeota archaeon LC_2]|nr:MAG: GTPase KRas precursor [Candidatus Heimdallarchaeota archaeon LC_2]
MAERRKIYKVVVLGDGAVGKTALRHRYLGEGFKQSYSMTIGADFAVKRVELDGKEIVAQIWDLAGQLRFQSVREVYYQGATGALLVFDITRSSTFESIPQWVTELLENNKQKIIPMVLIGNKSDLRESSPEAISFDAGQEYAKSLTDWSQFEIPYVETSALNGENVEDAFATLLRNIETNFG